MAAPFEMRFNVFCLNEGHVWRGIGGFNTEEESAA